MNSPVTCGLRAASLAACIAAASPCAANLITNGDFEAGNTGFTSSFTYVNVSTSPWVNQYGVTTSSFAWTQYWSYIAGDHTTGQGKFLIADIGSTATVWQQTVAVSAGTDYTMSAWLATWSAHTPATLAVEINGQVAGTWSAPAAGVAWTQRSLNWNSGSATSATIRFYATQVFQPGDDVGIDDIVLVPAPGAVSVLLLARTARRGRRR